MKYSSSKISTLLFIILMFLGFVGESQNNTTMETYNTSGEDALGSAGSVSYSIGQVFYSYIGESVYNVAQGVQHSTIAETDGEDIDTPEDIDAPEIDMVVYPNPTTDYINLAMKGVDLGSGQNSYQLFSYQGKLIQNHTIQEENTQINLSNLSSSIYLLQVFVKNKIWKTFKILKN